MIYTGSFIQNTDYPVLKKPRALSGLTQYAGPWTVKEVVHLLRRTMFGAKKSDIDYFLTKTVSQAVDELLTAAPTPAPPLNNYNTGTYTDPNVPAGQTWVNAAYDNIANGKRRSSFVAWWYGVLLNQNRSIHEKMTLFWHNHFSTQMSVIGDSRKCYMINALQRTHALGNFKDLTKAITVEPAMLNFLNGVKNTKNAPDENYGRELQELFTVGKEPTQPYTEDDVKAAARVLTGYRIDNTNYIYTFDPNKHDSTDKQFSVGYNNTVITGQTGANGEKELDDLMNMIFVQQQVAEYLCRKLYRFFVYYEIDSTVDTNVIQPLANIFRTNNYDIVPVLKALLNSEHFFDVANRGCVLKNPVDFFVGSSREFDVIYPDNSDLGKQYAMWYALYSLASANAMTLGEPPNVAGWPAYYQEPSYHEIWINSDTYPKRVQWSDLMINTGFTKQGNKIIYDVVSYVKTYSNPSDPNALIADALNMLYSIDPGTSLASYLKTILLSGQTADHYWSDAWVAYINNPTDQSLLAVVETRLKQMFQYLLDLAEHQLS